MFETPDDPFLDKLTLGELIYYSYRLRAECHACKSAKFISLRKVAARYGAEWPWRKLEGTCPTCARPQRLVVLKERRGGFMIGSQLLGYHGDRELEAYAQCIRCSRRKFWNSAELVGRYGRNRKVASIKARCKECGEVSSLSIQQPADITWTPFGKKLPENTP